jgi:hypothetical protein
MPGCCAPSEDVLGFGIGGPWGAKFLAYGSSSS